MKELRMRKSGLFYETFDEDAVIMHYLFNYKIIDERVAFPTNSLDKVINALNEQEIDYLSIGGPERIKNEFGESNIKGIYPIGEGAGYAGGITSAAMDGLKIAEEIAKKYTNINN